MPKMTDYPKLTDIPDGSTFIADTENGTRGIIAENLAKSLIEKVSSEDFIAQFKISLLTLKTEVGENDAFVIEDSEGLKKVLGKALADSILNLIDTDDFMAKINLSSLPQNTVLEDGTNLLAEDTSGVKRIIATDLAATLLDKFDVDDFMAKIDVTAVEETETVDPSNYILVGGVSGTKKLKVDTFVSFVTTGALDEITTLAGTDEIVVNDGTGNKKISAQNLSDSVMNLMDISGLEEVEKAVSGDYFLLQRPGVKKKIKADDILKSEEFIINDNDKVINDEVLEAFEDGFKERYYSDLKYITNPNYYKRYRNNLNRTKEIYTNDLSEYTLNLYNSNDNDYYNNNRIKINKFLTIGDTIKAKCARFTNPDDLSSYNVGGVKGRIYDLNYFDMRYAVGGKVANIVWGLDDIFLTLKTNNFINNNNILTNTTGLDTSTIFKDLKFNNAYLFQEEFLRVRFSSTIFLYSGAIPNTINTTNGKPQSYTPTESHHYKALPLFPKMLNINTNCIYNNALEDIYCIRDPLKYLKTSNNIKHGSLNDVRWFLLEGYNINDLKSTYSKMVLVFGGKSGETGDAYFQERMYTITNYPPVISLPFITNIYLNIN